MLEVAEKAQIDMYSSLFSVKWLEGEEIIFWRESFSDTGRGFYLNRILFQHSSALDDF